MRHLDSQGEAIIHGLPVPGLVIASESLGERVKRHAAEQLVRFGKKLLRGVAHTQFAPEKIMDVRDRMTDLPLIKQRPMAPTNYHRRSLAFFAWQDAAFRKMIEQRDQVRLLHWAPSSRRRHGGD